MKPSYALKDWNENGISPAHQIAVQRRVVTILVVQVHAANSGRKLLVVPQEDNLAQGFPLQGHEGGRDLGLIRLVDDDVRELHVLDEARHGAPEGGTNDLAPLEDVSRCVAVLGRVCWDASITKKGFDLRSHAPLLDGVGDIAAETY